MIDKMIDKTVGTTNLSNLKITNDLKQILLTKYPPTCNIRCEDNCWLYDTAVNCCPNGLKHKSSNQRIIIYKSNEKTILQCHSDKCSGVEKQLYIKCFIETDSNTIKDVEIVKITDTSDDNLSQDSSNVECDTFISITDDNLAKLFKQFYGNDFVYVYDDKDGKTGKFYYYSSKYWNVDVANKKTSADFWTLDSYRRRF